MRENHGILPAMRWMGIFVGLVLFLCPVVRADEPTAKPTTTASISWLSFQIGKFGAMVDKQISPIAQFSWTPRFPVGWATLRAELGFTFVKAASGSEYGVFNTDLFIGIPISFIMLEPGGGVQTWGENRGTHADLGGNLVFLLPGYLDRVYLGYARLFATTGIDEFKFGVGLTF